MSGPVRLRPVRLRPVRSPGEVPGLLPLLKVAVWKLHEYTRTVQSGYVRSVSSNPSPRSKESISASICADVPVAFAYRTWIERMS